MRTGRIACPLILLVAIATGCGGEQQAGTTSSPPAGATTSGTVDPCALMTKAEIDAALGGESKPERPSEANLGPALVTCRYVAPRGQGLAVMTVMVRTGSSEAEAKSAFESARALGKTEPAAGLGDEAFWLLDQLYVRRGTRQLTLSGDVVRDKGEELARKAIERLQ